MVKERRQAAGKYYIGEVSVRFWRAWRVTSNSLVALVLNRQPVLASDGRSVSVYRVVEEYGC
jgi:hypothetical protein